MVNNSLQPARVRVVIDRMLIERNGRSLGFAVGAGRAAASGADVTVSGGVVSSNFRGISARAFALDLPNSVVVVENTIVTLNTVGLLVPPNVSTACAMIASDSSIIRNPHFGIEQQGGNVITSFGGNTVFNNASKTFGSTQGKL